MLRLTLLATAATFAAAAPYPKDSAWAHAMDKNCCGGGEACGMTYCAGQDTYENSTPAQLPPRSLPGRCLAAAPPRSLRVALAADSRAWLRGPSSGSHRHFPPPLNPPHPPRCVQSWEVDDFDTECKPGAAKVQLRRQLQATMPTHVTLSAAAGGGVSMPMSNLGTCCGYGPHLDTLIFFC